jgi:hypothetical protein
MGLGDNQGVTSLNWVDVHKGKDKVIFIYLDTRYFTGNYFTKYTILHTNPLSGQKNKTLAAIL